MPERDPQICPQDKPFKNNYRPIIGNASPPAEAPWLGTSWRASLGARFVFNANFFDDGESPAKVQCSNGLGISVSGGKELSDFDSNESRHVIVFYNRQTAAAKGIPAEIVAGSSIKTNPESVAQFAIAGNLLVKDGVAQPSQPDATNRRARIAAGAFKGQQKPDHRHPE